MTLCSNEHNAVEKYYEVFFRRHIALHLLNRNEDSGWIDADMPTCRNAEMPKCRKPQQYRATSCCRIPNSTWDITNNGSATIHPMLRCPFYNLLITIYDVLRMQIILSTQSKKRGSVLIFFILNIVLYFAFQFSLPCSIFCQERSLGMEKN